VECVLKKAGVAQPDNPLFVMTDFGAVMIVGLELMGLEVSVNEGVRMIGVGLVQVLLRHRRGTEKPRHKGESNDRAPRPSRHTSIMAH
jgi:hypothetical protein